MGQAVADHFRTRIKDDDVDLYDVDRLRGLFGGVVVPAGAGQPATVERELIGPSYRAMLGEMAAIIGHQWVNDIRRSSIKGFLLHGAVGVGKTSMAMRVAYELAHLLGVPATEAGSEEEEEVVLVLIDSSDIARGRYGDTEERIRALFDHARHGPFVPRHAASRPVRRTILLFDDVETLFMSRTVDRSREWHFSQNAVFFHQLDSLDTSRVAVFLTTNRLELMDGAIVDRFIATEFGTPSQEILAHIARERAADQRLTTQDVSGVLKEIESGCVTSVREVERLIQRRYVEIIVRSSEGEAG